MSTQHVYLKNVRIAATNLLFWFSAYLFLPILPIFYSHLGMSEQLIGLAVGAYSIGSLCFRIFAGKASDLYGCQKVAIVGFLLCIVSLIGYFYTSLLGLIVICRLLHGIGSASYSTSAAALVLHTNDKGDVKEAMALYTLCSMVGTCFATIMATTIYRGNNFVPVVILSLVATLASFGFFPKKTYAVGNRSSRPAIKSVAFNPFVYMPTLNQFALYLCFGALMTFLPLSMEEQGIKGESWLFYYSYGLTVVISRFFVSKVCKLVDERKLVFYLLLLFALVVLSSAFNTKLWQLPLYGLGVGLCTGLGTPILAGLIASHISPESRGTAMGFFTTAIDLGVAVGSMGMGFIASHFGLSTVFVVVSLYTLLSASIHCIWAKPFKRMATGT